MGSLTHASMVEYFPHLHSPLSTSCLIRTHLTIINGLSVNISKSAKVKNRQMQCSILELVIEYAMQEEQSRLATESAESCTRHLSLCHGRFMNSTTATAAFSTIVFPSCRIAAKFIPTPVVFLAVFPTDNFPCGSLIAS